MTGGATLAADVVVAGGGPAGALAARQLAVFGFRVVLVHSPLRRRQHLGESLSASAPRLLASYGLTLPESVYAPRPGDHFVRWGGREDRIPVQPEDGRGEGQRLVRRDRLDAWALAEARRTGVRVVEGSVAEAAIHSGRARLTVRRRARDDTGVEGTFAVDATGRRGALSRSDRRLPGFRTTAITGHFPPGPREATLIASFADGWVWSAPVVDGRRDVTVMLDAATARDPERAFRAAVRRVDLRDFAELKAGAALRAADVTPYVVGRAVDREARTVAVGDAASALDPLTGLGAMKAMDSGLTAAVALRTALERPDHAGLAFGFHEVKERGLAEESAARTAAFYAEERRFADRPFWRRRSRQIAQPPAPALRIEPDTPLRSAPGVEIRTRGILENDWIVPAEVLVLPGRHRPAHRMGQIALPDLFRTAIAVGTAARAVKTFPAPERATRTALAWLTREGFLIPRHTSANACGGRQSGGNQRRSVPRISTNASSRQ